MAVKALAGMHNEATAWPLPICLLLCQHPECLCWFGGCVRPVTNNTNEKKLKRVKKTKHFTAHVL